MNAISFEPGSVPVIITSPAASLAEIFRAYFRYYHPHQGAPVSPARNAVHLSLSEVTMLPPLEQMIPVDAELISQGGIIQLWRQTESQRHPERFYLRTPVAAFHITPDEGSAEGLITPEALATPHLLTNTWALFALLLLLRARGLYHLHAATVLSPEGKLYLICGRQHSGKSTLTTALGLAGWQPVSDDSMLVYSDGSGACLAALRKQFHLSHELLTRWPELSAIIAQPRDSDRACVAGLEFFGTVKLAESVFRKIDYVILPEITGEPVSRTEPVATSDALLRLAEQSIYFPIWPEHTRQQMTLLTKLAGEASCLRLLAGADMLADPLTAARILNAA